MATTVWKGQLSFGLVSIPVRIVRAGRQERIAFRRVYRPKAVPEPEPEPELEAEAEPESEVRPGAATAANRSEESSPVARVQHQYVTQDRQQSIAPAEVLKAVEVSKGEFAVFRPDEVKKFNVETSSTMEILQFLKTTEIDPVYFNASYYLLPDRGGEKPYSLLFAAMRKTEHAALATVAMHGRNQFLTLRPGAHGIVMHTLFFETEVHAADEYTAETSLASPKEIQLAEMLISQLEAPFNPAEFRNERIENMRAAVEAKMAAREAAPAAVAKAVPAPVIDIMEALRRSLSHAPEKKPAARESTPARKGRQRKAGGS